MRYQLVEIKQTYSYKENGEYKYDEDRYSIKLKSVDRINETDFSIQWLTKKQIRKYKIGKIYCLKLKEEK